LTEATGVVTVNGTLVFCAPFFRDKLQGSHLDNARGALNCSDSVVAFVDLFGG
jgi:hypothetical protein